MIMLNVSSVGPIVTFSCVLLGLQSLSSKFEVVHFG